MRRGLAYVSRGTESALQDERRPLEQILSEVARTAERMAEEYAELERTYCEPVGDVFTGDVLEEIIMEEIEEPVASNVRQIRPQPYRPAKAGTAQGG
jgi:hypothetical protein